MRFKMFVKAINKVEKKVFKEKKQINYKRPNECCKIELT